MASVEWKDLPDDTFLQQFQPEKEQAITFLRQGNLSALMKEKSNCTVVSQEKYLLVDSQCLILGKDK